MTAPMLYTRPIASARLVSPATKAAPHLKLSDPAIAVMTDLAAEAPHVASPDQPVDAALTEMIAFGVRLLLVVRESDVVGLITSYDIMGERPIKVLQSPSPSGAPLRHVDVRVEDVMTPLSESEPVRYRWVMDATVGDIATLFRNRPDTHLLVLDEGARPGDVLVRGIFSRTRLDRQINGSRL